MGLSARQVHPAPHFGNRALQPDKDCLVALPAGALPIIPDDERTLTKEEFARTTDKQLVEALARLRERMKAKKP